MPELLFGVLPVEAPTHGSLIDRFVVPPFSVFDTRQEYWQSRRRAWLALGIKSEIGRGLDLLQTGNGSIYNGSSAWSGIRGQRVEAGDARAFSTDLMKGEYRGYGTQSLHELRQREALTESGERIAEVQGAGTSIFDPVLCEIVYRWWAPADGTVLDPFAGGSVRGVVAAMLGHPYTGIDLSGRQVAANIEQGGLIVPDGRPMPVWHNAESREFLSSHDVSYDLVFSCPPYYDLEVYSNDPADLSNMRTYADFLEAYEAIIAAAAGCLRPDRYMVLVVSEIRDGDGYYRGLVPDTIFLAQAAGLRLYNDAILVNAAGSAPIRAANNMESRRKLVRVHQNVLVFAKGDPERGWSYDRQAPPSPQLSLFGDNSLDGKA